MKATSLADANYDDGREKTEGRLELGAVSWRDLEELRSSGTSGNHLEIPSGNLT